MSYIKEFFKYSFDFVGVTGRKQFWLTTFMVLGLNLFFALLCFLSDYFIIAEVIVIIVTLVPMLSITARRLHDTDRSAYNLFWILLPFVGLVILAVYCLEKTKYFI